MICINPFVYDNCQTKSRQIVKSFLKSAARPVVAFRRILNHSLRSKQPKIKIPIVKNYIKKITNHREIVKKSRIKFYNAFFKALKRLKRFELENLRSLQDAGFVAKGGLQFAYVDKFTTLTEKLKEEIFQQFFNDQLLTFLKMRNEKLKELQSYSERSQQNFDIPEEMRFDRVLRFNKLKGALMDKHSFELYKIIMRNHIDKKYKEPENIKQHCKVAIIFFEIFYFLIKIIS